MMRVKTYLDKTERGDLGLYAAQNIAEGTIVWKLDQSLENVFSEQWVESLPELTKEYIKKYAYQTKLDPKDEKTVWILCMDDNKFLNHSEDPNLEDFEDHTTAVRDIKKGEELTCNYYRFDLHADKKLSNDFS